MTQIKKPFNRVLGIHVEKKSFSLIWNGMGQRVATIGQNSFGRVL